MSLLYRMGTGNGSGGDLKPYIVQFTCDSGYIGQTLTMTYKGTPHAGETVDNVSGTVVSDGTKGALTLYPMHSGNWECSCYSSVTGTTMKKTIELSYWGTTNVEFNDIPDGATVTPTDNVQTWLHCANIWDKQYTTVSQVVADKTTLNALVQNENANDYLVRSTTFSTTLCENNANNEAMYYLGLYDGCANKLLADDYWSNAICSADVLLADGQTHLFEKVLNEKVPTMISNTAPSGEAFGNGSLNNGGYWEAFNPNKYCGFLIILESYIRVGYKFANSTKVAVFSIYNKSSNWSNGTGVKNAKLQGYKTNLGWIDLTDVLTFASGDNIKNIASDKIGTYEKYQLVITSNTSAFSAHSTNVEKLQFYGREEA